MASEVKPCTRTRSPGSIRTFVHAHSWGSVDPGTLGWKKHQWVNGLTLKQKQLWKSEFAMPTWSNMKISGQYSSQSLRGINSISDSNWAWRGAAWALKLKAADLQSGRLFASKNKWKCWETRKIWWVIMVNHVFASKIAITGVGPIFTEFSPTNAG